MEKYVFPKDFILGVSTASHQIEGKVATRDRNIWDDFACIPGKVLNGDNGNIACDSINNVKEDVRLIKQLGVKSYRFSISWPRVISDGTGKINKEGLQYYIDLVNMLKKENIIPFVTLYHWDLPSCLQAKGGWTNKECIDWFLYYCKIIFETFGNDIPYYVTINEPFCVATLGYGLGVHAPGIADLKSQVSASINLLIASGRAIKLYKSYGFSGQIGICLNFNDYQPINDEAKEMVDFIKRKECWWYYDAMFKKAFPEKAVEYYKSKNAMPEVSAQEMEYITTVGDFLGINHYNPIYYDKDGNVVPRDEFKKSSIGWIIEPLGLERVMKEIAANCPLDLYILENGVATNCNDKDVEIHDTIRVNYYKDYLHITEKLIKDGMNLKGYFAWSLLDNYEWACGYTQRFGLVFIDYNSPSRTRTPKDSYYFIKNVASQIGKKKLIFEENFEGNSLNTDVWKIVDAGHGFGNDEDQFYTSREKNIFVKDNKLTIRCIKEKYENRLYTSAKIVSRQTFQYGHYEFIAKIPAGSGSWPAIWMLPENIGKEPWPQCGEIDIMENVGKVADVIHYSLHSKNYNHKLNTQRTKFLHIKNASKRFINYAMDWTPEFIIFYTDGIPYAKFYKNDKKFPETGVDWPFDKPYNLIINLAFGGYWGRPIDEACLPLEFEIKSIKIYSWED